MAEKIKDEKIDEKENETNVPEKEELTDEELEKINAGMNAYRPHIDKYIY